jgi:5'-3' exonuclease
MTRLSEPLRHFLNEKITEASNCRDIQVVLSGYEEGEHKINGLSRAQPNHHPNKWTTLTVVHE